MSFIEKFLDWAHGGLCNSDEAQEFLRGRGSSQDQWVHHRIGYVSSGFEVDSNCDPNHKEEVCNDREKKHLRCDSCRFRNWSSIWEEQEGSNKKVCRIGKRIEGSVVLPLTSYTGQFIGFQVRSLREKNYDTFVVSKRPEGYFFGIGPNMQSIWSSREVWLVEGPFDQQLIERLVSPNVIALTTSSTSTLQMKFLKRFVKKIYLCLDLDKAGRDGVRHMIERNSDHFEFVNVKYRIPEINAKDPGDIWSKIGDAKFRRHILRSCE